jgi:hypothetical protein
MYCKLICILYALLCGHNFILVKSGCYTRGIEVPSTPAIKGTRPPPPHLHPINGRHALSEDPHTYNTPSVRPHPTLTAALPSRDSTSGELPPRRLPSLGISQIRLPVVPSFFSLPHGKPPWPGAAARPSSGEPLPPATVESTVELWTGQPGAGPRATDRVHVISY